jgi:Zn-dependent peptidase ImmA (M78 family)
LTDEAAVIGLTLRYKTDDMMWFTLFHELGHVLLHRHKQSFIVDNAAEDLTDQEVDAEMQPYEREANRFAEDTLIPPDAFHSFVRAGVFTNESIHSWAEELEIGPGLVVGRLQREGVIERYQGNALKQRIGSQPVDEE